MSHTRRSETFIQRIKEVIAKLEALPLTGDDKLVVTEAADIILLNTTDSPCMLKARQHEPIFVLRGNDKTSPEFVEAWSRKFRTWIANAKLTDEQEAKAMAKWRDAMDCAMEMREWPTARNPD
jgi:hypothetical protein